MKNHFIHLCVILFSILNFSLTAQTSCGSLDEINQEVEALYLKTKHNTKYKNDILPIPIQFHVTRGDDGISDFEPRFVDSIIVVLNHGFRDTPFQFYACSDINYIDDDDYKTIYYYSGSAGQDMEGLFAFHNSKSAINVYLPNSIQSFVASAWAYLPWNNNHSYIAPYALFNSNTHVHEMGHLLGLLHTHTGGDLADGSTCATKGDMCCDTPAEASLVPDVDDECNYIGNARDISGALFTPDVGNHMSYAPSKCRQFFTADQIDRMTYYYHYYIRKFQCDEDYNYTDASFENITTYPYPAVEGEPYSIIVTTRNDGNVKSERYKVYADFEGEKLSANYISNIYSYNPMPLEFPFLEEFPQEPGRYLICVETEGDSMEINPFNNEYCEEILVRQKEGIPDIDISELMLPIPFGEQNSSSPVLFELENVGSIKAEQIVGDILVDNVHMNSFTLMDLEVGKKRSVEIEVPLGYYGFYDVCIQMKPAFAEERLDNNSSCITYLTIENLAVDTEVDSIYIYPDDSLLVPEQSYMLYFRNKSNGSGNAWGNSSYLNINEEVKDSIIYPSNYGWAANHSKMDSFEFVVPSGITTLHICSELRTYNDTFPDNNSLCLTRSVDEVSSSNDMLISSKIVLFPNPVDEILTIESEDLLKNIKIYNNLGMLVSEEKAIEGKNMTINFVNYPIGVYHIVIETADGRFNRRVIKI